jgi:hypothetical protein
MIIPFLGVVEIWLQEVVKVRRGIPAMNSPRCLPTLLTAICLCTCGFPPNAWSAPGLPGSEDAKPSEAATVIIPGPLRSFMRMAGISQKVSPEEVLPLFAHNVFAQGYEGSRDGGRPTEFLILLSRYVHQAKELAALAPGGTIRVSNCEEAMPLLHVLGYRVRQDCGRSTTSLVTADPERAFLTIDSGFPLHELEETLQGGKPFAYTFPASRVPVLFSESDWTAPSNENRKGTLDLVETLLRDPVEARLYWALSRSDAETRVVLRQSVGLGRLLPFAAVLDFYGSHICVRSGRVIVPGGAGADSAWRNLVGASPESPRDFVVPLLAKDNGWLAAYFDALSRASQTQQAHFTETRLRRFYESFRGQTITPDAARPAFRPAPALLLLVTRLQWDANGEPYVPGNLEVWKEILRQKNDSKIIRDQGKHAGHLNHPEQLAETMFALCRVETESGPLQIYLMASELDSRRSPQNRLSPQTVLLLASKFAAFSNQYLIFSEFPELDDSSITLFLNVAESLGKIPNHTLRGNAMGIFEANVGIWQILARQGQIKSSVLNDSWQSLIKPFSKISSSPQLFDAGRDSLGDVLLAATGQRNGSQDEIIDLLAGPKQVSADGQRMHQEMANGIRSVLDGQRLVSLDTILALGAGLEAMAKGAAVGDSLIPLAGELREFEMPRPIFSSGERTQWATGVYNNRHTDLQMRTDLAKVIKAPGSREQLAEARGQLCPFFRDTLVGLNYAYYEPPGAQILHNNPLFVRSHDFSGDTVAGLEYVWQAPQLFGEGSPAGGGAHLVGSLADLPYVLAQVEQDFIAPENVQALIWRELVPGLLINATLPRWWGVSQSELHAITLYQRSGEELLTASVGDPQLRGKVMNILSDRMDPNVAAGVEQAMATGRLTDAAPQVTPADTFYLAVEFRRRFSAEPVSWGPAGQELEGLSHGNPPDISWERLSQDFGVPHPILADSYSRELLNLKPFPAFEGYSSRLLAETWESNNLYWARLADEQGYSAVMLNRLVPQLTHRMVEKIFASDFEDWPAMLRAMRETGEEFRQGKIASLSMSGAVTVP